MSRNTVQNFTDALARADQEVTEATKAHDAKAAKRALQVERGESLEVRTASRHALDVATAKVSNAQRRRDNAAELAEVAKVEAKVEAKALAKADATADALVVAEAKALEGFLAAIESARPALAGIEKAAEAARIGAGGVTPSVRNLLGVYAPPGDLDGLAAATPVAIVRRFLRVLENRELAISMANNHATTPNAGKPWPASFNLTTVEVPALVRVYL